VSLEFIRFLVLPDNRLLVVLVSSGGRTRDKLLHLERAFSQAELDETAQYLNTEYRGWTLDAIRADLLTGLSRDRERYDKLRSDALLLCDPALLGSDEPARIYVEGAAQIATAAEFADEHELGELLGAIEERQHESAPPRGSFETSHGTVLVQGAREEGAFGQVVPHFQIAASGDALVFHTTPERVAGRAYPRALDGHERQRNWDVALVNHAETGSLCSFSIGDNGA